MSLLINPLAGGGLAARLVERVLTRLHQHDVDAKIFTPSSPEESFAVAHQVAKLSSSRLLAVGGDGLIRLAATALADRETPLGIIAAGTGNDTARALGLLRGSLEDRIDLALSDATPVDLALGNEQTIVTSAICGFPTAVNERANQMKFPKGPSRYTLATLLEVQKMAPIEYRLIFDGRVLEVPAAAVVVSNMAYFGGGMKINPHASPTDGLLNICIIGDVSRFELLRSLKAVRVGRHVEHPKVFVHRATNVTIEGIGSVRADGEPIGSLPVQFQVKPASLLVAGASTSPA